MVHDKRNISASGDTWGRIFENLMDFQCVPLDTGNWAVYLRGTYPTDVPTKAHFKLAAVPVADFCLVHSLGKSSGAVAIHTEDTMSTRIFSLGRFSVIAEYLRPSIVGNPRFWFDGFVYPNHRLLDMGVWRVRLSVELGRKVVAA